MKVIILLVSIIMISFVLNKVCEGEAENYNECKNRKLEDSSHRCCFFSTKFTILGQQMTEKGCEEITKTQFDNIQEHIKQSEQALLDLEGVKDVNVVVNCISSYLSLSILGLIILLI